MGTRPATTDPSRITDSNIRIPLSEDSLNGPCPKDDSGLGWTITSGMWNTLQILWGLNMETLKRIHESCNSQTHLEYVDIFTPTRHILQVIRRTLKVDRVHGLPSVTDPTFFPSPSKNDETWWVSKNMKTVYLWDSMDNQDSHNTMAKLEATSERTKW